MPPKKSGSRVIQRILKRKPAGPQPQKRLNKKQIRLFQPHIKTQLLIYGAKTTQGNCGGVVFILMLKANVPKWHKPHTVSNVPVYCIGGFFVVNPRVLLIDHLRANFQALANPLTRYANSRYPMPHHA